MRVQRKERSSLCKGTRRWWADHSGLMKHMRKGNSYLFKKESPMTGIQDVNGRYSSKVSLKPDHGKQMPDQRFGGYPVGET